MSRPLAAAFAVSLSLSGGAALAQSAPQAASGPAPRPAPATGSVSTPGPAGRPAVAATLPNAFDGSNATATAPAALPAQPAGAVPDTAAIEARLREVIAAIASGTPDYAVFTDDLARQMREQAPRITPVLKGFGDVLAVEYGGEQNGASMFLVLFDQAATQWIIGQDDGGRINVLLFRPTPAEAASD